MVKSNSEKNTRKASFKHWSPEEHKQFVEAVQAHGTKNWQVVAKIIGTKNNKQCRSHYQKYEGRLKEAWEKDQEPQSEEVPEAPEETKIEVSDYTATDWEWPTTYSKVEVTDEGQFQNFSDEEFPYFTAFPVLADADGIFFEDFSEERRIVLTHSRIDQEEIVDDFLYLSGDDEDWIELSEFL